MQSAVHTEDLEGFVSCMHCRLKQVVKIGVFIVNPGVSVTRLNRFLPFFSVIYDMAVAPFVKTNSQVS